MFGIGIFALLRRGSGAMTGGKVRRQLAKEDVRLREAQDGERWFWDSGLLVMLGKDAKKGLASLSTLVPSINSIARKDRYT